MQISLAWPDFARLRKKKKKSGWEVTVVFFTFQTTDARRRFGQTHFAKGRVARRDKGEGGNRRGGHRGELEGTRRAHP